MKTDRLNKKIISFTILISIYVIFLVLIIPTITKTQNAETALEVSLCEQCHLDVIEKQYSYTHSPFILKQCDNCHAIDSSQESLNSTKDALLLASSDNLNLQHKIILTNLSPNTNYSFRIWAKDNDNKTTLSDINNFKTTSQKLETLLTSQNEKNKDDQTAPFIFDIGLIEVKESVLNKVTIAWKTDRPSSSQIMYGSTKEYGNITPMDSKMVTNHKIIISNISLGTTYHFKVLSEDINGNISISEDQIFNSSEFNNSNYKLNNKNDNDIERSDITTEDAYDNNTPDNSIFNIVITNINNNSAYVICETSKLSKIKCEYETSEKFQAIINPYIESDQIKTDFCIINNFEQIGIEACSKPECHPPQNLGLSHPVRVNSEGKNTQIPDELPTGNEGIILCITCHNPHGGDEKYSARLTISKKLCIACHKDKI